MEPEPLAQGDASPLRRLTASLDALRPVFTNPDLRCVQFGWGAHQFVVWSYSIGLAVYAFEIGGTTAVGLVGLIRLLPAAVAAPFAGLLGDRHSRRAVLMWTTIAMTATVALSAVAVYAGWPAAVVYLLGVGFTVTTAAYAPAQAGLLPVCSRTPQELSACNIALSVMDNAGFLAGSVGAGLLLAAEGPEAVFVLGAVIAAAGGFTLWRVTPDERPDYAPQPGEAGVVRQTLLGARTVRADPGLRLITVALTALVTFEGMMDVLTVVVALELLGIGEGSVGYLNAAWGAGALVGSAALTVLLKRGALAAGLVAGALITGAATALIGIWPVSAAAFLGLAGIGFGYTFVDVAGNTLLQRLASDEVLSRVFGVLETLRLFAMAIGSIAVPLLVALLGSAGSADRRGRLPAARGRRPLGGTALVRGGRARARARVRAAARRPDLPAAAGGHPGAREPGPGACRVPGRARGDHRGRAGRSLLPDRSGRGGGDRGRRLPAHRGRGRVVRRDRVAARRATDGDRADDHGHEPAHAGA